LSRQTLKEGNGDETRLRTTIKFKVAGLVKRLRVTRGGYQNLEPGANSQKGDPKLHIEVVEGSRSAHLHTIFASFWKTYDLLQSLLNVALQWFLN